MKVVEVKNLYKKYDNLEVIEDVSFEVNEGETLVILGASGSGKSTILRCINNLEKIDGGNIIINGRAMIKDEKNGTPIYNDKEILNKINLDTGMVFQDFNLFPHLSVKQNVMLALTNILKIDKNIAEEKAEELLDKMDLLDKKNSYPCDLSGGQKQRVSIARSLAINPKILCMDEPTSALDPELVGEVLKVIKKLAKEKTTMIIVTHEIKFAEEVADKIIFMDEGKIVEIGTPNEVIKNPKQVRTREFLKRYIGCEENYNKKRYVKRKKINSKEKLVDNKEVLKLDNSKDEIKKNKKDDKEANIKKVESKKIDNQNEKNYENKTNKNYYENGEISSMEYKVEENIETIEPKEVFKFFKEISDIPRESGNEKGIRDYLVNFAEKRKLEYYTDEYFNVIIRKKASLGYEEKECIGFQAHTDMICEKNSNSTHDFSKDSIKLIKDGDFIKADGTTLGADNGIGVAIMLAILDSNEIKAPMLECIFTSEEETTMIGAIKLDESKIKTKKIISLDNGKDDKMVISSANCMEWFGKIEKEYENFENVNIYELEYSNFRGGHSGGNISDIKRGNPIKLAMKVLSELNEINILDLKGGSRVNVIPRDFKVTFTVNKELENSINKKLKEQKEFYGNDVKIELKNIKETKDTKSKKNENKNIIKALSKKTSRKIINFINLFENGAIEFDENKNTILSANFAAVRNFENFIQLEYSLRSNDMKMRNKYLENLRKIEKENEVEIIWEQELFGFEPDYESNLVTKISEIYKKVFNKEIEKVITQGVVEGGFFKNKIKNLEYVCIGVNTYDVHSPKERVSISSIKQFWNFIKKLLEEF